MYTIHLNKLLFRAFHGVYQEETKLGNDYEIDLIIIVESPIRFNDIDSTVNYEKIYFVVNEVMQTPTPLLETVAENIIEQLSKLDSRIFEISLSIFKLHPPINGYNGRVGVTLTKKVR